MAAALITGHLNGSTTPLNSPLYPNEFLDFRAATDERVARLELELRSQGRRLENLCISVDNLSDPNLKPSMERLVCRSRDKPLGDASIENGPNKSNHIALEGAVKMTQRQQSHFELAAIDDLQMLRDAMQNGWAEHYEWANARFEAIASTLACTERMLTSRLAHVASRLDAQDVDGLREDVANDRLEAAMRAKSNAVVAVSLELLGQTVDGLVDEIQAVAAAPEAMAMERSRMEELVRDLHCRVWPWRRIRDWSKEHCDSPILCKDFDAIGNIPTPSTTAGWSPKSTDTSRSDSASPRRRPCLAMGAALQAARAKQYRGISAGESLYGNPATPIGNPYR